MAEAASYEEQRRRQMEANKRKLEELQLHLLATAVREAAAKPSQAKKPKQRVSLPAGEDRVLRRSKRVTRLPQPKYREGVRRPRGRGRSDITEEERSYAITKAEELQEGLRSDVPSFVKAMTPSYASGTCGLALPTDFCRKYLPNKDEKITLVDEADGEFDTVYLPPRALSAGWRRFSFDHEVVDGDCLVFELVERTKFKVYIIRASSYYKDDD